MPERIAQDAGEQPVPNAERLADAQPAVKTEGEGAPEVVELVTASDEIEILEPAELEDLL